MQTTNRLTVTSLTKQITNRLTRVTGKHPKNAHNVDVPVFCLIAFYYTPIKSKSIMCYYDGAIYIINHYKAISV